MEDLIKKHSKNWHEKHSDELTFGQRLADGVANKMGSWAFIIGQSIIVLIWMIANVIGFINHWDAYPFILLNLLFSTQAAYAAPILMMAQNRQNDRDRFHAAQDYKTNVEAKKEIEDLQKAIARIEEDQLLKIMTMLEKIKNKIGD